MFDTGNAMRLMLDLRIMFPFIKESNLSAEKRIAYSIATIGLKCMKSKAEHILSKSDDELIKYMQEEYKNVSINDVQTERELLNKLLLSSSDEAGNEANKNLIAFHQSLAQRQER